LQCSTTEGRKDLKWSIPFQLRTAIAARNVVCEAGTFNRII
jgi:hypothetical protein